MPKAKAKPKPLSPAAANGPILDVLTLAEAAAYLRLPEPEVVRLIREQGLPARQVGREWRFLLSAIRDWLSKGRSLESSKEAWSKLAGAWKHDPTLDQLREEIRKQRSLLAAEDEK